MAKKKSISKNVLDKLVENIEKNKLVAKEAYEAIEADTKKILEMTKHGFEYTTEIKGENDTVLYKRVRMIDNTVLFLEGKKLFKPAGISRFEVDIDYLKHPPKDKK